MPDMKPINMDAARIRIMKAYVKGLFDVYGPRRHVPVECEVYVPGPHKWEPNEEWIDPNGIRRKGRFVRAPGKKIKQTTNVPQGVVAKQVVEHAGAIVGAFLETLAIMEESVLNKEAPKDETATIINHLVNKAKGC